MKGTQGAAGRVEGGALKTFTIQNAAGMSITMINLGATITAVNVPDARGTVANVTLGFPQAADYAGNDAYFGCIVGRYANRIAGARFTLDGTERVLEANDGPNHLHGGTRGFDKAFWRGTLFTRPGVMGVRWVHTSRDGDAGYPGRLKVVAEYSLTSRNEVCLDYRATTSAPTPVNLTNHAYWNLAGAGTGLVLDHELLLDCPWYLPVDDSLIPTGEIRSVAGTPFDFTTARSIGREVTKVPGGYDHCFVGGKGPGALARVATVRDPSSGRAMSVFTTLPGVQLYSGNFLKGVPFAKHGGFCLETQQFPDSVNKGHFPSCILRPGMTWQHRTVYAFSA